MASWQEKLALTAQRNRQDIVKAKLSRREMMRLGLLTAGGALVAKAGLSSRAGLAKDLGVPPSPPSTPWAQSMPLLSVKSPVGASSLNGGAPDGATWIDGCTKKVPHQLWSRFPVQEHFELVMRETSPKLHPSYTPTKMWGFDGQVPGPRINARYGRPTLVRFRNELPSTTVPQSFGITEIDPHLHNAHTPSESDGYPNDYIAPVADKAKKAAGFEGFRDVHYPNVYAGFSKAGGIGDRNEALGSLWFHDHHHEYTSQNVYKGVFGCYILYDDLDTGDEGTGLRLPSGKYDVPIFFNDMLFDRGCQQVFDLFNLDGILGDKFLANGAIQPFFEVDKRRYRLRLYTPGPSRFWQFALWDGSKHHPFWQISSDGNLLPNAVKVNSLMLTPGERADIIVDFDKIKPSGGKLWLVNRAEQFDGRKPEDDLISPGAQVIEFRVGAAATDNSQAVGDLAASSPIGRALRPLPDADMAALQARAAKARVRTFDFDRSNGSWTVNGQHFDDTKPTANPGMDTEEVWVLRNGGGGWAHPIHLHFEEFRVLSHNGQTVQPGKQYRGNILYGRKDVVQINDGDEVRILMKFRDMKGRYVMHCHNVVHEDHAMMVRFDVV
jgi:FtsP/CotA-like multicopper oxidase with cupredoxin domain